MCSAGGCGKHHCGLREDGDAERGSHCIKGLLQVRHPLVALLQGRTGGASDPLRAANISSLFSRVFDSTLNK